MGVTPATAGVQLRAAVTRKAGSRPSPGWRPVGGHAFHHRHLPRTL